MSITEINMSANLKICAKRLLKFVDLKKSDAKKFLKAANSRLIQALSEIAFNIREGVVKVSNRVKNSQIVKGLSLKTVPLKTKCRLLCTVSAPLVIQALIASVVAVLRSLTDG